MRGYFGSLLVSLVLVICSPVAYYFWRKAIGPYRRATIIALAVLAFSTISQLSLFIFMLFDLPIRREVDPLCAPYTGDR